MRRIINGIAAACTLSCSLQALGDTTLGSEKKLRIHPTQERMVIDGIALERVWDEAEEAGNFFQNFPYDTSLAISRTVVRSTQDDQYLYIYAVCYDPTPGPYIIQTLRRDFDPSLSDYFGVFLDPVGDLTNGFAFMVNPYGIQSEGLLNSGGNWGASRDWDNIWYTETKRTDSAWYVEMAIPFRTLRYRSGGTSWKINFARNNLKMNELSVWMHVPRNFAVTSLAFAGTLEWAQQTPHPGKNIAIIPYAINTGSQDYARNQAYRNEPGIGVDAKVGVTPTLNLDLTVNPDFAQVDVDRQITNLTRFSLFFPERRAFFLENSDLFSNFGFSRIRPFFSRRIGLANGRRIPIYGGARLSGKLNNTLRIGAMTMQTAPDEWIAGGDTLRTAGQNYSVGAFQQDVFGNGSNIAMIIVNRQAITNDRFNANDYNRIVGIDYNLASRNNKYRGKLFYHRSFSPMQAMNSEAHASWLRYRTKNVGWEWNHEYVGENYNAEVGFTPRLFNFDASSGKIVRKGYWRLEPDFNYTFFPTSTVINNMGPGIYYNAFFNTDFSENEWTVNPYYFFNFQNSSELNFFYSEQFTRLFFPVDITETDAPPLPAGGYRYRSGGVEYTSNIRRTFTYSLSANYGSFYKGMLLNLSGEVAYRAQPWGNFAVTVDHNRITFPEPFGFSELYLIAPRIDLTFHKNVFFSGIVQYNNQIANVNTNLRLQWRFKPMSDLFMVYTDNYFSDTFRIRNRSFTVKFVYWFNV